MKEGDENGYFEREWKSLWKDHHSIRNDPRPPVGGPYYRDRFAPFPVVFHSLLAPFVIPLQEIGSLDATRVKFFEEKIQSGSIPIAVAVGIIDDQGPWAEMEGADYLRHTTFLQFLLDGHHKVQAAANIGGPVIIMNLISLGEINLEEMGQHLTDAVIEMIPRNSLRSPPKEVVQAADGRVVFVQNVGVLKEFMDPTPPDGCTREESDSFYRKQSASNDAAFLSQALAPATTTPVISFTSPAANLDVFPCRFAVAVFADQHFSLPEKIFFANQFARFDVPGAYLMTDAFHIEIVPASSKGGDPKISWHHCNCDEKPTEMMERMRQCRNDKYHIMCEVQDEKRFTCPQCGTICSSEYYFEKHQENHLLEEHAKLGEGGNPKSCISLGVTTALQLVQELLEPSETRTCSECGMLLPVARLLIDHMEKHQMKRDEIQRTCKICGKISKDMKSFVAHMFGAHKQ